MLGPGPGVAEWAGPGGLSVIQGSLPSQIAKHRLRGFDLPKVEMGHPEASPASALGKVLFGPFLQHCCLPEMSLWPSAQKSRGSYSSTEKSSLGRQEGELGACC